MLESIRIPIMGNSLENLRLARKWTQDQAAEKFGMSKGGYIKVERGERALTEKRIKLAAKIYGVPVSDIIADTAPLSSGRPATSMGRRLENIRVALMPDLPERIGFSPVEWQELTREALILEPDIVMRVQAVTKLPSGYIAFGDTSDVQPEVLSRLLAAALDDSGG